MRIALLAPVSLPVPPLGYGGTEMIVHHLAEGLVERGHEVTLYATGDSKTRARLVSIFPKGLYFEGIHRKCDVMYHEMAQVSRALQDADRYDLIHDHTKATGTILSDLVDIPCVTTIHNDFTLERLKWYLSYPNHAYVSISKAQARRCPGLRYVGTIYNGIDLTDIPFQEKKGDYLLFLGRIAAAKGAHTAIELAKKTGHRLILAGKVDPVDAAYYKGLAPAIDGDRIRYIGEVTGRRKWELIARAKALLFPIHWEEPFGLVLIEAMACGTPVLALRRGAVPEVVIHEKTGLVFDNEKDLEAGLKHIQEIAPEACRQHVAEHFTASAMVDRYLEVYQALLR